MAVARDVVELVLEHVAAFNAGDVERVLRGLSDDVVWQTGSDTFVGIDEVEGLLRDAAGLSPVLEITSLLSDRQRVAVEMTERYLHQERLHVTGTSGCRSGQELVRAAETVGVGVYRSG